MDAEIWNNGQKESAGRLQQYNGIRPGNFVGQNKSEIMHPVGIAVTVALTLFPFWQLYAYTRVSESVLMLLK